MTTYRGFNAWAYFVAFAVFQFMLGVFAVYSTPGPRPFAYDLLALGLTLSTVLACAAAIFDGVRHIRFADGDMDWGEAALERKEQAVTKLRLANMPT